MLIYWFWYGYCKKQWPVFRVKLCVFMWLLLPSFSPLFTQFNCVHLSPDVWRMPQLDHHVSYLLLMSLYPSFLSCHAEMEEESWYHISFMSFGQIWSLFIIIMTVIMINVFLSLIFCLWFSTLSLRFLLHFAYFLYLFYVTTFTE
jgi:hypothetical protein